MGDISSYEVEKILNKRTKNNRAEFLIKWRNYDDSHNLWLTEDKLDCYELIIEFEQSSIVENATVQPKKQRKTIVPRADTTSKRKKKNDPPSANDIDDPLENTETLMSSGLLFAKKASQWPKLIIFFVLILLFQFKQL